MAAITNNMKERFIQYPRALWAPPCFLGPCWGFTEGRSIDRKTIVIARPVRAIHGHDSLAPSCAAPQQSRMREARQYYIYIMASGPNGTLYTGMTNDLSRRVYEHREKLVEGFTKRYGVKRLVYFEVFPTAPDAIRRETRIKKYSRAWKVNLIRAQNPAWRDLAETLNG
jgi:putative endonuclease